MTQRASQLINSSRKEPAVKNTENKEGCNCCEKGEEAKQVPIFNHQIWEDLKNETHSYHADALKNCAL